MLGWGWGGLWRTGHGEQRAAAGVGGSSDAPAAVGGDERAGELQWKVGILFLRPFWVEKGRRRELGGGLGGGGDHGGRRRLWRRGGAGARGSGNEGEREGERASSRSKWEREGAPQGEAR